MNAALIANKGNCKQCEHDDQDNALFTLGEIENPEQALHFTVA